MTLIATPPPSVRLRAAADIAVFADIWPTLGAAGDGAHHVFQKRELIDIWLATIGAARGTRPIFLRVDEASGAPLLLLALGIERRRGVRVLSFLDGGVSDYNGPVLFRSAFDATEVQRLWRRIVSALPPFDAVLFDKMPVTLGGARNPLAALAPRTAPSAGYVITLADDWPAYVATRLHRPKDSRRKRRRLSESGPVSFRVAKTIEDARSMLQVLVRYKTRRYLELNGADGFDRPGYRRYFHEMTERLFPTGAVHLSVLTVGDAPVAAHWGLVADGRFYCLMLAHADGALAQYSPGRLLVEHLVEWSYARGLHSFDLGYGDAAWKAHFAPQRLPLAHAALPATPYGWAYIESRRLRDRIAQAATEQA